MINFSNDYLLDQLLARTDEILLKLRHSVKRYARTLDELMTCDVSQNASYQKNYAHFYGFSRFRQSEWKLAYFKVLENSKGNNDVKFHQILDEVYRHTNCVEASFSSKLVATINRDKPVIDRVVMGLLGLSKPEGNEQDRIYQLHEIYDCLNNRLNEMISDARFPIIKNSFKTAYPMHEFTDIKILDFMLWQLREKKTPRKKILKDYKLI